MGRKKIVEGFDEKKIGKNPFAASLSVYINEVVEEKNMYDSDGVLDAVIVQVGEKRKLSFWLERDKYVKFFKTSDIRKSLCGLKPNTVKFLVWCSMEVNTGKDYVVINIDRCKEECSFNHNTYNSCCKDLIDAGFLAKTKHSNVFWVNPKYFFSGNRMRKFPENVIQLNSQN